MEFSGIHLPKIFVVGYGLALLPILFWPCIAYTSLFAADIPDPSMIGLSILILIFGFLYPLWPFGGVVGSFLAFKKSHIRLAYTFLAISFLPFIFFGTLFIVVQLFG